MVAEAMRAALVGAGIGSSLTPAMHGAEGRALGLDYSYSFIDTAGADRGRGLPEIVECAQAEGLVGLNITHPFKIEIVQHLDRLSANATRLGAVNTVVFKGGRRIGHNTDVTGFAAGFARNLGDVRTDRVLLLGAGGAGAAVAFALLERGADELLIYDISPDRAGMLVEKLHQYFPLRETRRIGAITCARISGLDGVVNARPVGMSDHPGTAMQTDLLDAAMWVADIVYFPIETQLLAAANALGCRVMTGAGMAVFQAANAFELFTGYRADPARMMQTFNRLAGVG